jgi:regulator of extracellular matrix RemA (YlzA/DUF370 family)
MYTEVAPEGHVPLAYRLNAVGENTTSGLSERSVLRFDSQNMLISYIVSECVTNRIHS